MKTKFNLKSSVLGAAVAAAVAVAGSPAYALDAKISGQVNRAIMIADDGDRTTSFHVDNVNSSSRFRFKGSEDIARNLKAGVTWEVELQSNASDKVSQAESGDQSGKSDSETFAERWLEVWFQGNWGKVSLGQGDGAMNAGVEQDLSGTSVVSYAGTGDVGGAVRFRESVDGDLTDLTISGVISQQDFESRYDRLRYDTPSFGGFSIAVSSGESNDDGEDIGEYGLRYKGDLGGGLKIVGAVGVAIKKRGGATDDRETTGGSISFLLPNGLNFTGGVTNVEDDGPAVGARDSDFAYFKVGYKGRKHRVSLDFATADDQADTGEVALGNEADHFGLQYVWVPKKWAELFAGYKTVSLDRVVALDSVDDIDILFIGSRLKF